MSVYTYFDAFSAFLLSGVNFKFNTATLSYDYLLLSLIRNRWPTVDCVSTVPRHEIPYCETLSLISLDHKICQLIPAARNSNDLVQLPPQQTDMDERLLL